MSVYFFTIFRKDWAFRLSLVASEMNFSRACTFSVSSDCSLSYVYYKTKSVKSSIIVHATNNIPVMIPLLDQGLSSTGIIIYGSFILIGIYSLKALR